MSRELVNRICAALPGAEVSDPWGGGHDAWKVSGKMFASIGAVGDGVSLKTPDIDSAAMLIDLGRAIKAPYFHRSWVHVPFSMIENGEVPEDELRDRLENSYHLIRSKLPKKIQALLK
ncbi:MmcQ/YjbR family DNA-binding protein [Marinovum sp. 2_MG-2023]|uniref:MmcQ/YjbR family DNA-binding protein n=1 Tax=unclassified Marinovum TaxID=2647166 RepID=UPI0026E2B2E8|nr:MULTISPECIES: MmcQ/YjbR family DNA-binding protein [unclassified Marinovum]MDO6730437.1 MmcQ/YjbR family DNA-binding protein [Marinovum sp. 2_MG-2023]MDO6778417.1 MmcQ/YjbR family DNA-binding protein [Marinovum sp. 1_MG-2023]